jgi:hypothetical protein
VRLVLPQHFPGMKLYHCDCGAPLFFANTQCLACGRAVAYEPASDRMVALPEGVTVRLCANGSHYAVCNWLTGDSQDLCQSCRLNRTIPDLSDLGHLVPALNEMSLSLGHSDMYPFTPAPAVLQKLHCVHQIVRAAGGLVP